MKHVTPFFSRAVQLSQLRTRFFVPGHKGNAAALPAFAPLLPLDLTEIEGADDLSHPSGPLAESEQNMAKAFRSAVTLYSTFGSTSCIEAMLHLYMHPDKPIIMARGCHISALRALIFTGALPVWLPVEEGRIAPHVLEETLQQHKNAPVYITASDYFGRSPDIAALAAICEKAGSALLVDNAHGAHLAFLPPSQHPLHLGADAVVDSAHKTLPCLTGAALLHLRKKTHATQARELLNLYGSTSPSYLILESLDLCAGQLLCNALDFNSAAQQLAAVAKESAHLCEPGDDPLKLCLHPALGGWPVQAVLEHLASHGIVPEYCDGTRIVLMASACNSKEDFATLSKALQHFPPRTPLAISAPPPPVFPHVVCTPREAFFAPKERIPLAYAAGRVAAGLDAPCPPGVPLIAPGERISPQLLPHLSHGGILEIDVVK